MKVTYQTFYLHQGFLLMLPPVPWLSSRDLYAKLNFDGSYIPLIEKDVLEASSAIHPDSYWPHSLFKPRCIRSKSNSKHSLQVFNFVSTLANDCLSWKVTVLFWRSRPYTTARILPWGFMDKWKILLELRIENRVADGLSKLAPLLLSVLKTINSQKSKDCTRGTSTSLDISIVIVIVIPVFQLFHWGCSRNDFHLDPSAKVSIPGCLDRNSVSSFLFCISSLQLCYIDSKCHSSCLFAVCQ